MTGPARFTVTHRGAMMCPWTRPVTGIARTARESGRAARSESEPVGSLRMFQLAGVRPADSVIDAGGGASTLVDALLERGFDDVTVLDISGTGIQAAQRRLGPSAGRSGSGWWRICVTGDPHGPTRGSRHDRAVLHFLTADADRQSYLETLTASTAAGAAAVFATFAPDGPRQCSGLPVAR